MGVDVARCLALVGMIATHVLEERTASGELTTAQWLAGGRASALFAVLAGVSMALVSGRRTPVRGRDRWEVSAGFVVRAALVGGLGLVLGTLDTGIAVILTYYAVLFVLGLPFLGLTWRPLLALAAAWAVAAPVLSQVIRPVLSPRQFESPQPSQLADLGSLASELLFTGYYPAFSWLAYLILGLAIGRLDLGSTRVAARLATGGLGLAVIASLVSGALTRDRFTAAEVDAIATGMGGQTPVEAPEAGWRWLLVVAPHSSTPFDLLQTGGSAAFVIGACLVAVAALRAITDHGERVAQVVFGAGAMTLSLYTLHLLMRTDWLPPSEESASFVWHVLVVLWVGSVHAGLRRRGPLEWAVGVVPRAIRRS